jgi:hypothetical protein
MGRLDKLIASGSSPRMLSELVVPPTKPPPHRFTPGSLSDDEREQAEALGRSVKLSPAQLRALREGFAPALRRLREDELREAGVMLPPEQPQ